MRTAHYTQKNRFGGVVEKILMNQDEILRNGDDFTNIDARTGNTSTLDLTLISLNLASEFMWDVHDNTSMSDHLPIEGTSKFHFEKSNWENYCRYSKNIRFSSTGSENINDKALKFLQSIISIAKKSIPCSKNGICLHNVPWWCPEIDSTVK
jgi:hypothetical protein